MGGQGFDGIFAGAGADTIIGGTEADFMTGGGRADLFVFTALSDLAALSFLSVDLVFDFVSGLDRISFAGLGLTFVSNGVFTGANQISYLSDLSSLVIDQNGGGTGDLALGLVDVNANYNAATDLILQGGVHPAPPSQPP